MAAAGIKFEIDLRGEKELVSMLNGLTDAMQRRVMRQAVRAAVTPLNKAAKQTVPVRRPKKGSPIKGGQLKRSIGAVVRQYTRSGIVMGYVGPRRGFDKTFGTITRGKRKGKPRRVDPVRYSHLVELGTSRSVARMYMRRAFFSVRGQMQDIIVSKLRERIHAEVARRAKRGR